ncbi:MAG: phenylalanine--tRNA ligase subunit beta [Bacteroidetes bacterium]|nr:phenylalanine--tRNA ligase subunit beta [Bacteroidota bacterium]
MKISYNWLKEYVKTNLNPEEMAVILTDIGLEVEGVGSFQSVKGGLEGVVIGKVKTSEKHPNADKLTITTVDIGSEKYLSIVCGAPNVAAGQKVPIAIIGATLYSGNKEFVIKRTKIRGELSEGMICAEDELGLGVSHEGIMVLDETAKIGTPAKDYFKIESDTIFEIGLTPNRIDGGSHYGVARDLSAFLKQKGDSSLVKPSVDNFKADNHDLPIEVEIENQEACSRYSGLTIQGINVKPSPFWLQNRLRSIGLVPVNNVVDITNYILHETGQPLHAFNADKITGNKIIVKTLTKGSKFISLDEVERKLHPDDLMICNKENGMCIAGVFGGIDSGVKTGTQNIFLESAYFNPVYIRKTAKRHALNTDASFRFERGVDPDMIIYALKRAALLIKEIADGKISSDIVDQYPSPINNHIVELSYKNLTRLVGKKIDAEVVKKILSALEIKITGEKDDILSLEVPAYRVDVTREADVIEEILRIYGYNNIEISDKIVSTISAIPKPDKEKIRNQVSDLLTSQGFFEIMCNSITSYDYYKDNHDFPEQNTVKLLNPLSSDLNVMRQTLLYGGLESVSYNINRQTYNLKLFEFGNCYYKIEKDSDNKLDNYCEREHLALFITGQKNEPGWTSQNKPTDFFHLKSYIERILKRTGIKTKNIESVPSGAHYFSEGLKYFVSDKTIVEFGKLKPTITRNFDINQTVYCGIFFWDTMLNLIVKNDISFSEIPRFPEVKRDLALLLDKSVSFSQIEKLAWKTEKKLLKKINLFDVFEDQKIGKNKKSYAVSFYLQDTEKTLTDKRIDKTMQNFIRAFEKELGAKIR